MYTTDQEAKAMITQAIESGAATADEYDIDQIFDAVFEYDGKVYSQVVDQETVWLEVERGAWDSDYKAQMAKDFAEDADELMGRT